MQQIKNLVLLRCFKQKLRATDLIFIAKLSEKFVREILRSAKFQFLKKFASNLSFFRSLKFDRLFKESTKTQWKFSIFFLRKISMLNAIKFKIYVKRFTPVHNSQSLYKINI